MGKNLHNDFGEIILGKLTEWKKNADKEFHGSLIDAFWFMHLDFEHFISHLHPTPTDKKRNTAALHEDIVAVKYKIVEHYSRLFEADFQNYTENLLNEIYTDIFFDRNKTFEISSPPKNDLLSNVVKLIDKVKRLLKSVENFQSPKPISSLVELEKLSPSLNGDKLREDISRLKIQVQNLTLNLNESEFNTAIKICDNPLLKKYLTLFYYPIDGSFNHEIILVFLFGKVDWSKAGESLKIVVKRHEKFFLNIYSELKNFYPNADALLDICTNGYPRAVQEEYYCQLPKFSPPDEPRTLLFNFKKLISLYEFYCKAKNISPLKCVTAALISYKSILTETRLTEFHYAPMWADLPSFIMNLFGLNQGDLAKVLGIGNHNLTREKQRNTLVDNHAWFWQAATGFTYTYVLGETTIPYYGKKDSDKTRYKIWSVATMAYAEMFLNYVDTLTEYRKKLQDDFTVSQRKHSLTKDYIQDLSEKVQILMKCIQEKRVFLDELHHYENKSSEMIASEKLLQDNLLGLMDFCISLFKHPAFDYAKIPTHEKIAEAKAKWKRAEKRRNEALDLDKADEKIKSLEQNYENLKFNQQLLPRQQKDFMEKLKRKFSTLK